MELKIIEEELAIISTKKETAIVQKDTAIAEKDGAIARIKIEYDFVKRKCDAELEKLTKKPRPTSNKLKLPVLMRIIKHRLPNTLIGKCEIIGCENEVSHLYFYTLSKHGFIETEETYKVILVVCGIHEVTEEFPIKPKYQVPKKRVEVLLFRHGLPSSHIIPCAGCDNCNVSIHDAIDMHVKA